MTYLSVSDQWWSLFFVCSILTVCEVSSFSAYSSKSNESGSFSKSDESSEEKLDNLTTKERITHAQSAGGLTESPTSIDLALLAGGKYEIRSISGEPNYKSVNLTWDMDYVPLTAKDIICNNSDNGEPPKAFQIFICEMQTFGPHRCRAKVVDIPGADQYDNTWHMARHYMARIDNLRMATKYSFHVRPQSRRRNLKIMGRSEIFHNGIEEEDNSGHTIIIPTKGFAAEATKCLPNASEIQVETGPYFGGKIMVDGGKCVLNGNPNNPSDMYTMRIDHHKCGSMIKPETNTVETFITVQENLGIFTHSTRRFVVVCSYQSGMQTVRASFSIPGQGGATAMDDLKESGEEERRGRGLKPMKYVSKASLIRKEHSVFSLEEKVPDSPETEATVKEMANPSASETEIEGFLYLKNLSPNISTNSAEFTNRKIDKNIKYAKFVLDHSFNVAEKDFLPEVITKKDKGNFGSKFLTNGNLSAIGVSIVLSLAFLVGFLWILQRIRAVKNHNTTTITKVTKTISTPISLRKTLSIQHQHNSNT